MKMTKTDYWADNSIQFPRLLAEIRATGSIDNEVLAEAMDLEFVDDVEELFDRAQEEWEEVKKRICPIL